MNAMDSRTAAKRFIGPSSGSGKTLFESLCAACIGLFASSANREHVAVLQQHYNPNSSDVASQNSGVVEMTVRQGEHGPPMEPETDSLEALTRRLREFADEREWGQFHVPRSLLLALQGEVGEVAELLQWVRDDEANEEWLEANRERLSDELADVLLYLVRLADVCGVNLVSAAVSKMRENAIRYPISVSKGSAAKQPRVEG